MIFAEFSLRSFKDQSTSFDEFGPILSFVSKPTPSNSARSSVGSLSTRNSATSATVKDTAWFWTSPTGSNLKVENIRLKQELGQVIAMLN
jgi:hypothetical protein